MVFRLRFLGLTESRVKSTTSMGPLEGVSSSVRLLFEEPTGSFKARFRVPDAPRLGKVKELGVRGAFGPYHTLPDVGLTFVAAIRMFESLCGVVWQRNREAFEQWVATELFDS
jgi:hypothetical protein